MLFDFHSILTMEVDMLGWKAVSEKINNVNIDDAKMILRQAKFVIKEEGEAHVVLHKKGTQLTTESSKVALEAALIQDGQDIIMHLRYDTFVLFDTGDLKREAVKLKELILNRVNQVVDPMSVFKALGDEKRLKAFMAIIQKPMHNQEIAELVGLKPTTMSHHMLKLIDAGLVKVSQGDHNKSIYSVNINQLKQQFEELYMILVNEERTEH